VTVTLRRSRRRRLGATEVLATIILLGISVTLFGGLFYIVNSFQRPPPAPSGQFAAALTYAPCPGSAWNQVCAISVTHLVGLTLPDNYPGQIGVYLASSSHPAAFGAGPYSLLAGGIAGTSWSFGQKWTLSLAPASTGYDLTAPDTITVQIVASNQLVFKVVLSASAGQAPYFQMPAVNTVPAGGSFHGGLTVFNVTVQVANGTIPLPQLNNGNVTANICQLQALACRAVPMNWAKATGLFWCHGTTTLDPATGTYYVFITATDSAGKDIVAIPVVFVH